MRRLHVGLTKIAGAKLLRVEASKLSGGRGKRVRESCRRRLDARRTRVTTTTMIRSRRWRAICFRAGFHIDAMINAGKIDAARISARMKFTAAANSAKMEERPRGRFYSPTRPKLYRRDPIGTHLFLLIARLRGRNDRKYDGRVRDDGISLRSARCRNKRAPRTSPENLNDEPTPRASDATARFRG